MSPLAEVLRDARKDMAMRGVCLPTIPIGVVMHELAASHYTGALVLHLRDGKITEFDVPNTIKIRVE